MNSHDCARANFIVSLIRVQKEIQLTLDPISEPIAVGSNLLLSSSSRASIKISDIPKSALYHRAARKSAERRKRRGDCNRYPLNPRDASHLSSWINCQCHAGNRGPDLYPPLLKHSRPTRLPSFTEFIAAWNNRSSFFFSSPVNS